MHRLLSINTIDIEETGQGVNSKFPFSNALFVMDGDRRCISAERGDAVEAPLINGAADFLFVGPEVERRCREARLVEKSISFRRVCSNQDGVTFSDTEAALNHSSELMNSTGVTRFI